MVGLQAGGHRFDPGTLHSPANRVAVRLPASVPLWPAGARSGEWQQNGSNRPARGRSRGLSGDRDPLRPLVALPAPAGHDDGGRSDRRKIAVDAATLCSECCELSGVADPMFVAAAARALFDSDLPTD